MKKQHFEVRSNLPSEVAQRIEESHTAYEASHGVVCDFEQFWLLARDDSGTVTGVLSAYTAYAEIYVDDLSVAEAHRGCGLGTALIEELETRYRGRGYNNINLVTNEFQAVAFYKKCGFEIEFVRQNKLHPALTKTFFVKFFDTEKQTRGVMETGELDAG